VERGGQKQDITLNVAQVATDASKDLESDPAAAGAAAVPPASGAGPTPSTPPPPGAPAGAPPTNENPSE
jgi:hypothetical protein